MEDFKGFKISEKDFENQKKVIDQAEAIREAEKRAYSAMQNDTTSKEDSSKTTDGKKKISIKNLFFGAGLVAVLATGSVAINKGLDYAVGQEIEVNKTNESLAEDYRNGNDNVKYDPETGMYVKEDKKDNLDFLGYNSNGEEVYLDYEGNEVRVINNNNETNKVK